MAAAVALLEAGNCTCRQSVAGVETHGNPHTHAPLGWLRLFDAHASLGICQEVSQTL